jgi:hypothetical protein
MYQRAIALANRTPRERLPMSSGKLRTGRKFTKPYIAWKQLRRRGALPLEWTKFDDFIKVVGEPPAKNARLSRHDLARRHGPGNTYWAIPKALPPARQIRLKLKERYIAQNQTLLKIRNAKDRRDLIRAMMAARKAGFSYQVIGLAAGMTRQRAHQIIMKHSGKHR